MNSFHWIWLGSSLRPKHVERIKEWVELNPDHIINIWVDPEYETEIKKQLDKTTSKLIRYQHYSYDESKNNS